MTRLSLTRVVSATIAACGLALVVFSVNTHGDRAQAGVSSVLRTQAHELAESQRREIAREGEFIEGSSLDMVDMFQWMCASPLGTDIRGWVGLWFLTLIVGGVPTAVFLRSNRT